MTSIDTLAAKLRTFLPEGVALQVHLAPPLPQTNCVTYADQRVPLRQTGVPTKQSLPDLTPLAGAGMALALVAQNGPSGLRWGLALVPA